jgi:hypothetical protein
MISGDIYNPPFLFVLEIVQRWKNPAHLFRTIVFSFSDPVISSVQGNSLVWVVSDGINERAF